MKRRRFLNKSACGLAGIGIGAHYSQCSPFKEKEKQSGIPNILIIVADDAGWCDVGYHDSEIKTPNIDQLASDGVELDQFYVSPVCSPTRAAFITGRPNSRYGILGALQLHSTNTIPYGDVTIAEVLKSQGFETAITGKWHLGMRPQDAPHHYGFDHTYGYVGPWIDQYTHCTTDSTYDWHRNGNPIKETGHATDLITDEAIRFIRDIRDKSKPFLLYVPYSVPHLPLQEEKKWLDQCDHIDNESRRYFAASMTHMDYAIGRLITTLKEENIDKETLVIFFSDNGGVKGGHRNWVPESSQSAQYNGTDAMDSLANNEPLRGWKGGLYEGGIRVPALMSWPGTLNPQKVSEPMVVYDILPTLAHFSGAPLSEDCAAEGINIWPAVTGGSLPEDRILYWRTNSRMAVRKGNWKLIHNGKTPNEGSEELYNVVDDPYETINVAEENPSIMTVLHNELIHQYDIDYGRASAISENPHSFDVYQNSPNPFNTTTTIHFIIQEEAIVTLDILNITGQKVDTLIHDSLRPGNHTVMWDASDFSAGVYFYRIKAGNFSRTMKMTLLS